MIIRGKYNRRYIYSILLITIILMASTMLIQSTSRPVAVVYAGGAPPEINNVTLNRLSFYRGLQTLGIIANVSDDDTEPQDLAVRVEIVFADGLKLEKNLTFLEEVRLFDVRIPIPSSAALGTALVRVIAEDKDMLTSTYETTISILSDRPFNELRASVEGGIQQLGIALNLTESMGINATQAREYLERARSLSDMARVRVEVLEDVDGAMELYREAMRSISRGVEILAEITSLAFKSQDSIRNAEREIEIASSIASIAESMGLNVSSARSLLAQAAEAIDRATRSYSQASFEESLIYAGEASRSAAAALDTLRELVRANSDTQKRLWLLSIMYLDALERLGRVSAYVASLKSLGVDVSDAESGLALAQQALKTVRESLSQGVVVGVEQAIQNATKIIDDAQSAASSRAREYAERNINITRDLVSRIESRIVKPDTTYAKKLLELSQSMFDGGEYVLSISYSQQALSEAARLLKVASDQELATIVGLIAVIAVLAATVILLVIGRRRGGGG